MKTCKLYFDFCANLKLLTDENITGIKIWFFPVPPPPPPPSFPIVFQPPLSLLKIGLNGLHLLLLFQGVRFDPELPTTIRIEFAKANTKVTKPANTKPISMIIPHGTPGIPSPTFPACKFRLQAFFWKSLVVKRLRKVECCQWKKTCVRIFCFSKRVKDVIFVSNVRWERFRFPTCKL